MRLLRLVCRNNAALRIARAGNELPPSHYASRAQIRLLPRHTDISGASSRTPQTRSINFYSITASALARSDGGMVMPSPFAVFRLTTSSYLVGACTGRSAGFSPLRMRST